MAARENQGLQIALILLVMVTVVLCVTTYVFYSKSEARATELETMQGRLSTAEAAETQASLKVQELKYMISGGTIIMSDLMAELENFPLDSSDPDIATIRAAYERDMKMFGDTVGQKRNYQLLPQYLMTVIMDKNKAIADANTRINSLVVDKRQIEDQETQRTEQFDTRAKTAETTLATERSTFNADRTRITGEKDKLFQEVTSKNDTIVTLQNDLQTQQGQYESQLADRERIIAGFEAVKSRYEKDSFEVPDAVITAVNQKLRIVYINVGLADGLRAQQTFSVYDQSTSGVMSAEAQRKGSIEVTQVLEDHLAICRILDDDLSSIITAGDVVHTPAWTPGYRLKFVVVGFIDITGDGRPDNELLASIIQRNGGTVEDEVTPDTRYLIEGERRSSQPGATTMTSQEEADLNNAINDAGSMRVGRMSLEKFLSYMGWKRDVRLRTVGTTSGSDVEFSRDGSRSQGVSGGNTSFRRRTPPARGNNGAFD